jgi:hypothetical protein
MEVSAKDKNEICRVSIAYLGIWNNKVLDVIAAYPCNKLQDLFPGVLEVLLDGG